MPAGEPSAFHAAPFAIHVDAAVLDDLRARIRNTRLPGPAAGEPWAQGTDRDWLAGLLGRGLRLASSRAVPERLLPLPGGVDGLIG